MKPSQTMVAGLVAALFSLTPVVSAGWIYPLSGWLPISATLPGAMYQKRDLSEVAEAEELVERGVNPLIYAACSNLNMASEYDNYPINGFLFGGATIGGSNAGNLDLFEFQQSNTTSAYNCCALAQQSANSTLFFYTSNPSAFNGFSCTVITSNYCSQPNSVIISGAGYNGTAPRGTSYYNFLGNGRCGPGVTVPVNVVADSSCASSEAAADFQNAESFAASGSCYSFSGPGVANAGGANPAA